MRNLKKLLTETVDTFHHNRLMYVLRAHLGGMGAQYADAVATDLAEHAAEKAAAEKAAAEPKPE